MKTLEILKGIGVLLVIALAIYFIIKIVLGLLWLLLPLAFVTLVVYLALKYKVTVKAKR